MLQVKARQGLIVPSKLYGIMAAGRPTIFIGPDNCEPAQIIHKNNAGIVVSPGDEKGVIEAINSLVNNSELRAEMGKRGREYYDRHFGRQRSVSGIIKTIENIAWL